MSGIVIAIDGPAGAGKSTVAKMLARRLSIRYLDTGAMYRAIALKASRQGLGASEGVKAAEIAEGTTISFGAGDPQRVFLDGEDVTDSIRTLEMGELASALSAFSEVRKVLVAQQQAIVRDGGVVLEGRDATTVIAPNATVKVFLTASLEERAKRRTLELDHKGEQADFTDVRRSVQLRDHRDITRDDSPLTVADGALVVESGGLTPEQVADRIIALANTQS